MIQRRIIMNIQPKEIQLKTILGESSEDTAEIMQKYVRLYRIIMIIVSVMCLIVCVCLCFRPVAKIGSVSMGNSFQIISEKIGGKYESSKYLGDGFVFVAIISILCSSLMVLQILPYVKKNIVMPCEKWKKTITNLIVNVCLCLIVTAFIHLLLKNTSYYYGCSFTNIYIIGIMILVPNIIKRILNCIFITDKEYRDRTEAVYSYVMNMEEVKSSLQKNRKIGAIALLISVTFLGVLSGILYSDGKINITNLLIRSDCELNYWFDSESLKVGEGTNADRIIVDKDKNLVIDMRDDSRTWIEYGNNYLYYQSKISELIEQRNELMPDKVTSNKKEDVNQSMEKYFDEIKELQEQIDYLREKMEYLPCNYAEIVFYDIREDTPEGYPYIEYRKKIYSYTHNRDMNYCDEEGKKWGYSDNSIMSRLLGENIELSKTEFDIGTDFNNEKIVAYVTYSDGSKKISVITPTNIEELNNAGHGTHTLEWSDEWGKYEFEIEIN